MMDRQLVKLRAALPSSIVLRILPNQIFRAFDGLPPYFSWHLTCLWDTAVPLSDYYFTFIQISINNVPIGHGKWGIMIYQYEAHYLIVLIHQYLHTALHFGNHIQTHDIFIFVIPMFKIFITHWKYTDQKTCETIKFNWSEYISPWKYMIHFRITYFDTTNDVIQKCAM